MKQILLKFLTIYIAAVLAVISGIALDRHWHPNTSTPSTVGISGEIQAPIPQRKMLRDCAEEEAKFCSGLVGIFKVSECLYGHAEAISKSCLQQLQSTQMALKPCEKDIEKLCGLKLMDLKALSCIKNNQDKLSPACLPLIQM